MVQGIRYPDGFYPHSAATPKHPTNADRPLIPPEKSPRAVFQKLGASPPRWGKNARETQTPMPRGAETAGSRGHPPPLLLVVSRPARRGGRKTTRTRGALGDDVVVAAFPRDIGGASLRDGTTATPSNRITARRRDVRSPRGAGRRRRHASWP